MILGDPCVDSVSSFLDMYRLNGGFPEMEGTNKSSIFWDFPSYQTAIGDHYGKPLENGVIAGKSSADVGDKVPFTGYTWF